MAGTRFLLDGGELRLRSGGRSRGVDEKSAVPIARYI